MVCPICKVGILNEKYFHGKDIVCGCIECFKEIVLDAKYFINLKEVHYGKKEKK